MPDGAAQQVVLKKESDPLDTILAPGKELPREGKAAAPETTPAAEPPPLETNNFSTPPEKRAEPEAAVSRAPEEGPRPNPPIPSPALETRREVSLPPSAPAAIDFDSMLAEARMPGGSYAPTVLDKIVDFLAGLLKKLERFLIGRLESRRARRRYKLRRIERPEPETAQAAFPPEDQMQAYAGERIKWQDRKKKRFNVD